MSVAQSADLPYFELDELVELFQYKNLRAAKKAIKTGKFPVPVYYLNTKWVADVAVVNAWFKAKREEGLATIESGFLND